MRSSSPWDMCLGVADDAALGAAEGDVDDGALPGHPGGEGADFVEGDVGGVADAAFAGAAGDGVLDAVAGEDFDGAVVHADGDVDDDFAGGVAEHLPDAVVEVELVVRRSRSERPGLPRDWSPASRVEGAAFVTCPFFCCWYQRFSGHRFASSMKQVIRLRPDRSVAKLCGV